MTANTNSSVRIAALILALLFTVLSLPLACTAVSYTDASVEQTAPPIEVEIGDQCLTPVHGDKGYALCLPGGTDLSALSVTYIGAYQLYLPESNKRVDSGNTAVMDFSAGDTNIYEYDAANNRYFAYPLRILTGAQIPRIYITLDESPYADVTTLEWLHENKSNSTTGTMYMESAAGDVLYDGALDTFKGRGNTSFVAPGMAQDFYSVGATDKKSYNIKLAKKTELIEGAGKMKKWSLLHMRISEAYYYDFTGLCSMLGFRTYADLVGERYFDTKAQYTDLYVNGEYRGVYILTERMDVNAAVDITDQSKLVTSESEWSAYENSASDPAIASGVQFYRYTADAVATEDLDLTGGYLLEINFKSFEQYGFVTAHNLYFDIKAPDVCTKEQVQYIAQYVQEFENALYSPTGYNELGKHYSEYADLDSLASMILTYGFFQNWELFRTSTYMYLDVTDSEHPVLTFGPAWDFETGDEILKKDTTLFGEHNVYTDKQQYVWLEPLWQKGDFMQIVYEKVQQMNTVLDTLIGSASDEQSVAQGWIAGAYDSLVMNWERWSLESTMNAKGRFSGHDNNFDYWYNTYLAALRTRRQNWNKLWNGFEYLYGVDITGYHEAGTGKYAFDCTARGNRVGYQWYRVANGTQGIALEGETSSRLITEVTGSYYCVVTGKNNAYAQVAAGSVFSGEYIAMASPILSTDDATEVEEIPADTHTPGEWEILIEPTCTAEGMRGKRCTACEEHEVLVSEVLPAKGHDDGAWSVLKAATEREEGIEVLLCTVCKTELDRRPIKRLYNNPFIDVMDAQWFAPAVEFAVQNKLMNGVSDTLFAPDLNTSRAMVVVVLHRMEGTPKTNVGNPFADVSQRDYYYDAVRWAYAKGIVQGKSSDSFAPNDNMTREEFAAVLYRYANYKNVDTSAQGDLSKFSDQAKVNSWATAAVTWANGQEIITGIGDAIVPQGFLTRAQTATMLMRYMRALAEM